MAVLSYFGNAVVQIAQRGKYTCGGNPEALKPFIGLRFSE